MRGLPGKCRAHNCAWENAAETNFRLRSRVTHPAVFPKLATLLPALYTQLCLPVFWGNHLSTNTLCHSVSSVGTPLPEPSRKGHTFLALKLHFGPVIIIQGPSCFPRTHLCETLHGAWADTATCSFLWSNARPQPAFNSHLVSWSEKGLKPYKGLGGKCHVTRFCGTTRWAKSLATDSLFCEGRTIWTALRSLRGKCHILTCVRQQSGESIFELTARFPQWAVFPKVSGDKA